MRNVTDTGTSQRLLNFAIPFAEGFRDVYVKMGGDNVDTYVAPWYKTQVDNAIAAGCEHVGHYWVPDANPNDPDTIDTPTQQADWMIDRLYRWDPVRGFIVLDNENLDGALRFGDAGAAEFVERVKARLRIPGRQVLFYTNLSDARAHAWPLLLATGARIIIAAPSYPPGQWPDIPTIPRDRIVGHQYGTKAFDGVVTDVNVFTDNAFDYRGAPTVSLEQKARDFAALYPTPASHPSGGDGSWDQDCGRVMFRFGSYLGWNRSPGGDINSAYRAYRGSTIVSTNPAGASIGAYHWWDIGGEANGHVMQQIDANTLVFGGTSTVWEDLGVDIGFMSVAEYNRQRPTARYLGWSRDYSGGIPNLASVAGGGYTPIEEDDMPTLKEIRDFLWNEPAYDDGPSFSQAVKDLHLEHKPVQRDGKLILQRQDNADTNTMVRELLALDETGGLDVPSLVAQIVPEIVSGVVAAVTGAGAGGGLTEAQVEAATERAVRRVLGDAADPS